METYNTIMIVLGYYQFKSYYVVWKLYGFLRMSPPKILFKSYYVVWKPEYTLIFYTTAHCLNRTMQYGNQRENAHNIKKKIV